MELTIKQEKLVKINISDDDAKDITKKYLIAKFDFYPADDKIVDGNIVREYEQCGGSHCWYDEKIIREATEMDYALNLLLSKLA